MAFASALGHKQSDFLGGNSKEDLFIEQHGDFDSECRKRFASTSSTSDKVMHRFKL